MSNVAAAVERRCWDACCFIAMMKGDKPEYQQALVKVVQEARDGRIQIVVSTVTLVELLWGKRCDVSQSGKPIFTAEQRAVVEGALKNSYVVVVGVTQRIAELARELCWEYSIHPHDAIHVATALHAHCSVLENADGKLLKKNVKLPGLEIRTPTWTGQSEIWEGQVEKE